MVEDEIKIPEPKIDPKNKPSIVNMPPSPPLLRRPRPPNNAPLKMNSQPAGIPRLPPKRKQKPIRPPLLNLPGIPQIHQRYPHPNFSGNQNSKIDLSKYKEKLRDPDFHQNLTKAHVYHASDLDEEVKDLDREEQSVPSFTKALLSYLQDANPFKLVSRKRTSPPPPTPPPKFDIRPSVEKVDLFEGSPFEVTESRIQEMAPPSKASKIEILDDIEVVYRPIVTAKPTTVSTTTTTESTTTTITTTTTTTATTTTQTTTTTHDPIADHVNLLLQQYFSTQTPNVDTSDQGVPMITYDDENNSIVMEYLSPDGTRDKIEQSGPEQEVGEAEVAVPNFFPQPDNADTAILPSMLHHSSAESKMTSLDRVFEPSQKTGDADWFVLDENGNRRVRLEEETLEEISAAMKSNEDQYVDQDEGIEEIEDNTERVTVSDFQPIVGPNDDYV